MDGDSFGHGSPKKESLAAQLRKSNKPLMEKRRRERINSCLDQLKAILMEVTKKESSYYSKLEKADILEMTVKYLKNLKRQTVAVSNHDMTDLETLSRYVAGFNECTKEVTNYLTSVSGLNDEARSCMLAHLANSLQRNHVALNDRAASKQTASPSFPTGSVYMLGGGQGTTSGRLQTVNVGQMQVLPARLANGEMVFLLTSPQNDPVSITTTSASEVAGSDGMPNVAVLPTEPESRRASCLGREQLAADSTFHQPTSSTFDEYSSSADSREATASVSFNSTKRFSSRINQDEANMLSPFVEVDKLSLTTVTPQSSISVDVKPLQRHHEPSSSTRMKEEDLLNNNEPDVELNPMWRPW